MIRKYSLSVLLAFSLLSCGANESVDPSAKILTSQMDSFPLLADSPAPTASIEGVTLKNVENTTTSITPSVFPKQGEEFGELRIKFSVSLTVPAANTSFQYDKAKWAVAIGGSTQAPPRTTTTGLEVDDGGGLGGGGVKNATITLTIKFPTDKKLPDAWYAKGIPEVDSAGRERLRFTPYYTTSGGAFSDTNSITGIKEVFLTRETGSIIAGPSFGTTTVRDSSIALELVEPTNTDAQAIVNDALANVGKNTVASFLVMYWDEEECGKAPGRNLPVNSTYDPKGAFKNQECQFVKKSDQGGASCVLGCPTNPESTLFTLTPEELAVPAKLPEVGNTESVGCYKVTRVSAGSQKSVAISGLKNGKTYGVVAWNVDAGGGISRGRSACTYAIPKEVPLAALEKRPDTRKTREDCFVATAASGDTGSDAVHYWRVIRDAYLTRIGFTSIYYNFAPKWSQWVYDHPKVKPALNFLLATSGRAIVNSMDVMQRVKEFVSIKWLQFREFWNHWGQAQAQSTPQPVETPTFSPVEIQSQADGASTSKVENQNSESFDSESLPGSSSAGIWFHGGNFTATSDQKIYQKFYPKRAYDFELGQTWRVADFQGELCVGGALALGFSNGKIPDTEEFDPDIRKREILYFTQSFQVMSSYRYRYAARPWVSPRFSLGAGALRYREEEKYIKKTTSTGTPAGTKTADSETEKKKEEDSSSLGVSHWKPVALVRLEVEFSLGNIMRDSGESPSYSYGLEDIALSLGATYRNDFSNSISQSGYLLHAGFNLLLL